MPGQHGQGTDAAVTAGRPGANRFSDHGSIAGAPGALKGARTRRNQRIFVWEYRRREPRGCLSACPSILTRPHGATWRSGYATVCKTVYTSSILVVASTFKH
jgi:hypothetical protein